MTPVAAYRRAFSGFCFFDQFGFPLTHVCSGHKASTDPITEASGEDPMEEHVQPYDIDAEICSFLCSSSLFTSFHCFSSESQVRRFSQNILMTIRKMSWVFVLLVSFFLLKRKRLILYSCVRNSPKYHGSPGWAVRHSQAPHPSSLWNGLPHHRLRRYVDCFFFFCRLADTGVVDPLVLC